MSSEEYKRKLWPGIDPALEAAVREAFTSMYPDRDIRDASGSVIAFRSLVGRFYGRWAEGKLTWGFICEDARTHRSAKRHWPAVIAAMLRRGMCVCERDEALLRLLPAIEAHARQRKASFDALFSGGDLDSLHLIECEDGSRCRAVSLRYENPAITDALLPFLATPGRFQLRPEWALSSFEESLGELAATITRPEDFGGATLSRQLEYYSAEYAGDDWALRRAVGLLQDFYRFLIRTYPEHDFFPGPGAMCESLIMDERLHRIAKEGFAAASYSPGMDMGAAERVVLVFRGYEGLTPRVRHEEYRFVDLSAVGCELYRAEIWRYWLSTPRNPLVQGEPELGPIRRAMSALWQAKQQDGYPNPDPSLLTNQEALMLRELMSSEGSLSYRNAKLGAVRRFLRWCRDDAGSALSFDELFFDYLVQFEEPAKTGGESLSEDELRRLVALMREKAADSLDYKLCLVILQLVVETEFRVSQICSLQVDSVRPSVKPGTYDVYSTTKTSGGTKRSQPITETTYRRLMDAIACTEELREQCAGSKTGRYIFLYMGEHAPRVMYTQKFSAAIKDCCRELGLDRAYSAENLRDTHMTLALEHILRSGGGDAEYLVLSGHRHVDTAKSSYIELAIQNMLEATCGIVIEGCGAVAPSEHIVGELPAEMRGPGRAVEGGCGSCSAESCTATGPLPCLACRHFVTTPAHEPFFLRAIEAVDALIEMGGSRHDIEDLQTVKTLNALYLKEIYLLRETGS